MGFIEDLRRQRDVRKYLEEEREKEAMRLDEIRRSKLGKLEDETARITLKRQVQFVKDGIEAGKYFNRSEFPRLVKELVSVESERGIVAKTGIVASDSSEDFEFYERSSEANMSLIWYKEKKGPWQESNIPGVTSTHDVWGDVYNTIVIGCNRDGVIRIRKRWGDIKLSLSAWVGNPAIQEEALGRAYRNPRLCLVRHRNIGHTDYGKGLSGIS